jgi:hypothetical protein
MGYIGVQPAKGQYRKLTDISGGFNGTATSFQLSVPPGGVNYYIIPSSPQQLMVSVGGIIQNPGVDYTTTGSQIIFTTAPASGLSFFGTFLGDVGNGVSASGVDYIATGAGAVTRTTASKLGDIVSVKDFGAVGNGVADDTAAIQAAITSASDVVIPAGTYKITSTLTIGAGKRITGAGINTTLNLTANVALIDTTNAFRLNDLRIVLQVSQTATVIRLNANTGSAYQANGIDLSGITILGNNADCVAIHFKFTNNSYMAYNNMRDIAVVAEGVKKACILFEVDNSSSFIQGNTFSNLNLVRGGVRYISNGVTNNSTRMIGNYFDGISQTATGANEIFELSGINNGWLWDSGGFNNLRFHKDFAGVVGGFIQSELSGDDRWSLLSPEITVTDGWGERVRKYNVLATNVISATLSTEPKAARGLVEINDPCVNKLDQRFTLTGMGQAGEIVSIGNSRRSAVTITNTATLSSTAQLILPLTACTLTKYPELKIGFRKSINGFFGAGTPTAWNPRCDCLIGLLSDDGLNGVFMTLVAIGGGDIQTSTISLVHRVAGVNTVLDNSLTLLQDESCYFTLYTDNTNVYMKATKIGFAMVAGAIISENVSYGLTTGFKSVARSSLFNGNTVTLNPQVTLTSTDKENGRCSYRIYGTEFRCTEM